MNLVDSPALRAVLACLACAAAGCASIGNPAPRAAPAALDCPVPLAPGQAAVRAIEVSPRIRAASLRLDAATHRARAMASPPDPSVAIALGVPIDGLGGSPISLSIMEGIGWLLQHDAIVDAAERERELAARELVATSVSVAADARRLVRALAAARDASEALAAASEERTRLLDLERAAADLRESTPARVRERERDAIDAHEAAIAARLSEHELSVALASLLAIEAAPQVKDDDGAGTTPAGAPEMPATIEVVRARARVARLEASLAASGSPLGSDPRLGAGASRDIEDRESATFTLEIAAPIFRRTHELEALRADLAAEQAELDEAERVARVDADHAFERAQAARAMAEAARKSWRAARHAREIVENTVAEGEASRADLATARAADAEARARSAERRMALADALFALETRTSQQAPERKEASP